MERLDLLRRLCFVATSALAPVSFVLLATGSAAAQQAERHVLAGNEVAIYNLTGELVLEPGRGGDVVVLVTRGGEHAARLEIATGEIDGRETLRVLYPADRIVNRTLDRGRTTMRVREDGTFGDGGMRGARQVTIAGSGAGLEAYADVRVQVPAGQRLAVYLGVGEARAANVAGELLIDVAAAHVETENTRGPLRIDTGAGGVRVRGATGDLDVDTGSGAVEVSAVDGPHLRVDTGSGGVWAADIRADDIEVDTGSGRIELSELAAQRVRVDTGSGAVDLTLASDVATVEVDTGSGGVTMRVPESLGAEVAIDVGSGGIDVDVPVNAARMERSSFHGVLGDGRGRIEIDTGSGGVRLVRR